MNINPVIETASTDEVTSVLADSKKTFLNEISKYVEEGISTQKELLHFQRVGSDYFNGAVSLIQKIQLHQLDENKDFAISIVGDCRAVLETYVIFQDKLVETIEVLNLNKENFVLYSADGLSNLQRIVKKYSHPKIYEPIIEQFNSRNLPVDGFEIGAPMNWKKIATAFFGLIFFVVFVAISLLVKDLTPFAQKILTSLYIMGAGVVIAPFIADQIKVNGKAVFKGSEFRVSAIGGLALLIVSFVLQYID
ncbi:hypothetical protein NWF33_07560 [Klebsiella quasipneumoniae]|uniref:hypothetical protein n=1 Tax=Klebsiella pneumoniae complex TaxID=3390273 RepID=UPI001C2BA919|nr:hypothetical protein [Klebsiella quasipneumoniae]HBQ7930751.1 hypothetical protein [Klebsiella pneumoniae]HEO9076183.1 hypothetical protein [Klebsiella variicola]MCM2209305.1 hypothetical protein [Klebsiella quasipneumoniae]UVG39236.1 hypothetical protein NWF33_07560 [Klebsiella quasipneumoniae]HCQ8605646.1 hypothetical protein [Klebsiella pneumoniae]